MTATMHRERIVALAMWIVVAICGVVLATQTVGYDGTRVLAAAQALTPFLLLVVASVAGLAAWRQWHEMGAVAAAIGIGLLILAFPVVFPPAQERADDASAGVRVAAVNLLFTNDRMPEVADDLIERDLDVIVFIEYTETHRSLLSEHPLAARYPYREDRTADRAQGMGVWSRYPLSFNTAPDTINPSIDATVDGPDGAFRLLAVHPPPPVYDISGWRHDLSLIRDAAVDGPDEPTLIIGDFNASYWHPPFRSLLSTGLTDAHIANGAGWSMSWPTDAIIPPFVRLDHALTGKGLISTSVEDFRVPGSDHSGFVVTVAPARRATP